MKQERNSRGCSAWAAGSSTVLVNSVVNKLLQEVVEVSCDWLGQAGNALRTVPVADLLMRKQHNSRLSVGVELIRVEAVHVIATCVSKGYITVRTDEARRHEALVLVKNVAVSMMYRLPLLLPSPYKVPSGANEMLKMSLLPFIERVISGLPVAGSTV